MVPLLAPILRSDVQCRILADILAEPATERSVTDLARRAGTSVPTALHELDRAEAGRLVVSRRLGNTRLVRAEPTNPPLRAGPHHRARHLRTPRRPHRRARRHRRHRPRLPVRLLGACYEGQPDSAPGDIDLLVVGHPDRGAIYDAAGAPSGASRCPVQATIRTPQAWAGTTDAFIAEVRVRPLVALQLSPP